MSTKIWRAAVIGRTGRGNYGHGLDVVWKQFPNVQIVAVADENEAGLTKAAERLGCKARYADYRKMLREERPDLVSIGPRWPDCHLEMALAAAEARASIYMEKPISRTPAEADRMIDACDRAHVKLAVAHQMRIAPVLELAKRRIAEGAIGKLQEMRGRGKEDQRGGGEDLMVLGTHVMDLMRQFAGDPVWCFGSATVGGRDVKRTDVTEGPEALGPLAGDAISATYSFPSDVTGYFVSKRGQANGVRWGLDLYGSKGIMTIRANMAPEVHICESPRWTDSGWTRLVSPDDALPGNASPRGQDEANRALVADLLDAIEKDRAPIASGVEARWTIEMALAVYESHRTGGRVGFPLKSREHPLTAPPQTRGAGRSR
ncbi:MAG: Gfo/Idh/MocA family oxidoreductase [Bryobacteraceae bacterium]